MSQDSYKFTFATKNKLLLFFHSMMDFISRTNQTYQITNSSFHFYDKDINKLVCNKIILEILLLVYTANQSYRSA